MEVARVGGVEICSLTTLGSRMIFLLRGRSVLKQAKWQMKDAFWPLMLFVLSLATLASTSQCCGFLLSLLTPQAVYCDTSRPRPLHGKTRPRLGELPGLADRPTLAGRVTPLLCKQALKPR